MKELRPSGTYRSAFMWEFLVLDLRGSAPFWATSRPARSLLFDRGWTFQDRFLALFDLSSFMLAHSSSNMSSLGVALPGSSLSFLHWCSLCASHHDLIRSSQASVVRFEDCSVHSAEVNLFLVFGLFGVRPSPFHFFLLFLACPSDQSLPFRPAALERCSLCSSVSVSPPRLRSVSELVPPTPEGSTSRAPVYHLPSARGRPTDPSKSFSSFCAGLMVTVFGVFFLASISGAVSMTPQMTRFPRCKSVQQNGTGKSDDQIIQPDNKLIIGTKSGKFRIGHDLRG